VVKAWYRLGTAEQWAIYMSEIGKFTQPDASPDYFIEFLDFLDKREDIRRLREQATKQLNLAAGSKMLDYCSGEYAEAEFSDGFTGAGVASGLRGREKGDIGDFHAA